MVTSTIRMAWRNLGRNVRRTALTLGAIAVAQASVLLLDGMMNGFLESSFDSLTGPLVGHVQVHAPDWREERAPDLAIDHLEDRLAAIRAVPGVEAAFARAYVPALAARGVDGHAVLVLGVDFEAESRPGGLLASADLAAIADEAGALVGEDLAREAGIEIGDELALLGQAADGSMANDLVRVTGILSTAMDAVNRGGIVLSLSRVQEIFVLPDMAHEITVRGADPEAAPALARAIASLDGFDELETLPWRELVPEIARSLDSMGAFTLVVLAIVFLAASAGVANTMLMATFERRRELGMLLSLGTSPARLVALVLTEAVLLGLAGVAAGSAVAAGLVLYFSRTGIDMMLGGGAESGKIAIFGVGVDPNVYPFLTVGDFVPGIVGIVFVSLLAALAPAIGTARLEPMEAMRS